MDWKYVQEIRCGVDRGSSRNLLGVAEKNHKNCKLLLSTLRHKPLNFRIGSTDINRPVPTLVIPLLFCLKTF